MLLNIPTKEETQLLNYHKKNSVEDKYSEGIGGNKQPRVSGREIGIKKTI